MDYNVKVHVQADGRGVDVANVRMSMTMPPTLTAALGGVVFGAASGLFPIDPRAEFEPGAIFRYRG